MLKASKQNNWLRTGQVAALLLAMNVFVTAAPARAQAPVDQTHTAATADTKPVTWDTFVRAESDKYFKSYVDLGGFGKFFNIREPTPIDKQSVIRMNRDTQYSFGVFDLTTPLTITKPDTGDRFQSMMALSQDMYVPIPEAYKAGTYTLTQEMVGTRYVFVAFRTFVNANDPEDIKKVNAIQDQIRVEQASAGSFEIPNWDQKSQDRLRDAINVLAATMENTNKSFGSKEEVDPIAHLLGAAYGWGGNPPQDAVYLNFVVEKNDGETPYTLTVKDVPVDGFWSISLYNAKGFFQKNLYNAYSINNVTAAKNADGSYTIHFGGDPKQPNYLAIMDGWNYVVRLYRPHQDILDGKWTFPAAQPVQGMQTHQEPQQKTEAGDAEPQAPSAPEESKQEREPSVFQQLARDPRIRRYGHPPGDGWIRVPDTNTKLRFGGIVQANFIHDFQSTGFPFGDFIPSQIPVPTDDTPNTEFDPRTSRLVFESQSNVKSGSVHTMVSMDFAGLEQQSSVQPRLRQAYVSWVGPKTKVAFTVGQRWGTFLDLGVWPDIFDLEGPNAMTGTRQVMARGSYAFDDAKRLVGDLAVEQPESDVEGGTGLTSLPDLVVRINWQRDWGHLQAAAIGRKLIAESTTGTGRDSDFGWGLSLSGVWNVPGTKRQSPLADERGSYLGWGPRQDNVRFQIQGGSGIGRYVFDLGSAGGQDAVYDAATGQLTPLEAVGAFGAYEHWWADRWRSTLVGGVVRIDNQATQPSTALKQTIYAVANLVYRPLDRMDVGIEYYWGQRKNRDGDTGDANRLMISVSYGLFL